jgi:hypothetical protein
MKHGFESNFVVPLRAGPALARIELLQNVDWIVRRAPIAVEQCGFEGLIIVLAAVVLRKFHAGGHIQQIADRSLAVFGSSQPGQIDLNGIIDGANGGFCHCDADQHRRDRLTHRL